MTFLGVFEKELPPLTKEIEGDLLFLKMTSPIYDRYELYAAVGYPTYYDWRRFYDEDHGLIICQHRKNSDDLIRATTLYNMYSKRKSYTANCPTLQSAIDLIIENYYRHRVTSQIPIDPSEYWEPYVYNNKTFFNFTTGGHYYSGYRFHTGLVYAKDDMGRSVISRKRMTMEEVADYFRTLKRLGR